MEKGAYRIHSVKRSESPTPSRHRNSYYLQSRSNRLPTHEKRLATLITFLVVATVLSFGTAFYLFTARWEGHSTRSERTRSDPRQFFKVVEFEHDPGGTTVDESAKYLSYLPHSGFHNQRIAFENALILARLLNRTLLVPPVRLGSVSPYYPFDQLYEVVARSGKGHLKHCADVGSWDSLPVGCAEFYEYTLVPWSWMINFENITMEQSIIQRWDMSDAWLASRLNIAENDTFSVKDASLYHFRYVDADPYDMPSARFNETISVSLLRRVPHRLLQLGTLFGSSRLRVRHQDNIDLRKHVRENMVVSNDMLLDIADSIGKSMGGTYLAAHVRLGDRQFMGKAHKNIRSVWWKLVRGFAGLSDVDALELESRITNSSHAHPPTIHPDAAALRTPVPLSEPIPLEIRSHLTCRHSWYRNSKLAQLNVPLFISTDIHDPASNPVLRSLFDTFPCTFVLSDFTKELLPLERLKNGYDGLMLKDYLLPFLDAIIAGKAHGIVGTDGSTFSQYVQDILWRRYHGWEIVQRG